MKLIQLGTFLLLVLFLAPAPTRAGPHPLPQDDPGRGKVRDECKNVEWTDAFEIDSTHYTIVTNCSREMGRKYADLLESAYAALSDIFEGVGESTGEECTVYILHDHEDFIDLTGSRTLDGFYTPQETESLPARTVITYHGVRLGISRDTNTALLRQATYQYEHLIHGDKLWNAPFWLMDGTAVFFEASRVEKGKVVWKEEGGVGIVPRDRLLLLQKGIGSVGGRYIRLGSLIQTPQHAYRSYHSAHSWSLVHWMMNADEGKYRSIFADLWKTAGERRVRPGEFAEMIRKATGHDIDTFEEQVWKPYVMRLSPPPTGEIIGDKFRSRGAKMEIAGPGEGWEWVMRGLPAAELQVRLANTEAEATIEVAARMSGTSWRQLREGGMDAIFDAAVAKRRDTLEREPGRKGRIAEKEVTVGGYKAMRFSYAMSGPRAATLTKVVVLVPTVERNYEIRLTCPEENAEEVEPALAETVKSFKVVR